MFKRYDKVRIVNLNEDLKARNLECSNYGFVIHVQGEEALVKVNNQNNHGDYAVLWLPFSNLEKIGGAESSGLKNVLDEAFVFAEDNPKGKLTPFLFHNTDCVELIEDRSRYEKFGLKKGMTGMVALDYAVKGETLVDFGLNELNDLAKESMCLISVKLEDLKLVYRDGNFI